MTTQLLTARRSTSPLHPDRVLRLAVEQGTEAVRIVAAADPRQFDRALTEIETAVARYRSAFLTQLAPQADAALAYHDRANTELAEDFAPLYYRRAVLENVLARYERTAQELLA